MDAVLGSVVIPCVLVSCTKTDPDWDTLIASSDNGGSSIENQSNT